MKLETERLFLREFIESDFDRIFQYQNDERYLKYYNYDSKSEYEVLDLLNMFIKWSEEKNRLKFQFAIVLKENNELIGNSGIRIEKDGVANIGYELDPNYWGNGYAIEAMKSILKFGKEELKVRKIIAYCHPENANSISLLKTLGMKEKTRIMAKESVRNREELIFELEDF